MLQDPYLLAEKLKPHFILIGKSKKRTQELYTTLKEKYNLPVDVSSDIICMRKSIAEIKGDQIPYWITSEVDPDLVPQFFSNKQIINYSKDKYAEVKPALPWELPMLQVASDQWIGVVSVQKLMELRRDGLLHYNADTQRILKAIIRGEEVSFIPWVNKAAVKKIDDLASNGEFIPNTITLNIPLDDDDIDYDYDPKTFIMKLNAISSFDIVDGYHRLKGFERAYDRDNSFDMNVELRIICFSVDKARRFIHQEDQGTKMKKVDSESFNTRNPANVILNDINKSTELPRLRGKINNTDGLIRFGVAARAIKQNLPKEKLTSAQKIRIVNKYVEMLNKILDIKEELSQRRWTDVEIKTVFRNIDLPVEEIVNKL